jgi:hypothetical protein
MYCWRCVFCFILQALGLAVGTLRSELQASADAHAKEQQQQLRHELEGEAATGYWAQAAQ